MCPDQTECVYVNQQLNKQLCLSSVLTSPSIRLLALILFGSKRWSSQAAIMSVVIDLPPACCRPLSVGGLPQQPWLFGLYTIWQSWI